MLTGKSSPVAVPVRADKVGVDDAQREHKGSKGLQIQQEGLPNRPANEHHHRQHKDGNLHSNTISLDGL